MKWKAIALFLLGVIIIYVGYLVLTYLNQQELAKQEARTQTETYTVPQNNIPTPAASSEYEQSVDNQNNLSEQPNQQAQQELWYLPKEVGGTFTKEDEEVFTKLAARNDLEGIDQMIFERRLIPVGPGPCKMLDRGFLVSYIEYNGNKVYVSTEDVKQR